MAPCPYCSEHPGCWLQDAALSELHCGARGEVLRWSGRFWSAEGQRAAGIDGIPSLTWTQAG